MSEMVLGYQTALDYWRAVRAAAGMQELLDSEGKIFGSRELTLSERVSLALNLCSTEPPLHVVVRDARRRHAHEKIVDHVWAGPLTGDHRVEIGRGISVCRMPAVFCQLALELDEVELMRIALEMAGTYGIAPWTEEGAIQDLSPLVDPAELRSFAASARILKVKGAARACESLASVVPGSNSPRETDVAIAFLQPRTKGGLLFPGFRMNEEIRLPKALADKLGQSVIKPDFSWPNGTVVEYDSEQEHLTPEARARDERKRRAYRSVGMDCLTLTNGILTSNVLYEDFAAGLEMSLGLRRRALSKKGIQKRRDLRARLFGPEKEEAALEELSKKG